jgi:hypothetical protein
MGVPVIQNVVSIKKKKKKKKTRKFVGNIMLGQYHD